MRLQPDINTALATAVFVVSSCVAPRVPPPTSPASSSPPIAAAPAPSTSEASDVQTGWATYYAWSFAGRRTANGEKYNPAQMTAAHRTLPFGTMVEVRRSDGRSVIVRINDRGPYGAGRIIDLSRRAAQDLGMLKEGKLVVEVRRVPDVAAVRP